MQLRAKVRVDEVTRKAAQTFDVEFAGTTETTIALPPVPRKYTCGLLVGPSGSGKTTLLRRLTKRLLQPGASKAVAKHAKLYAQLGLSRGKPTSQGEQHRVDVAEQLTSGLGIDEFTSGLDRLGGCAMAAALRRHMQEKGVQNVVLASVHADLIPFLQPDWVWHTGRQELQLDIPRYSIRNVALRKASQVHWLPEQQLQTSALAGGGKLPWRAASGRALPAKGTGGAETTVLDVVVTPCSAAEAAQLQRQYGLPRTTGAREYRLATVQGRMCAVVAGATVQVVPRYAGLRLEPHVRAALAPLRGGGLSRASAAVPSLAPSGREREIPRTGFAVGLVVGAVGSGKSALAKRLFPKHAVVGKAAWSKDKSVVSHFGTEVGPAMDRLLAAGLDSVPSWLRPFHVLSNGEQMRVELGRTLKSHMVVPHFTTAIDRPSAQSMAASLGRFVRQSGMEGVVLLTSHSDVVPFLRPDWVWHMDTQKLRMGEQVPRYRLHLWQHPNVQEPVNHWENATEYVLPQQRLQLTGGGGEESRNSAVIRGKLGAARRSAAGSDYDLTVVLQRAPRSAWELFKHHHYLSHDLPTTARCFVASLDGQPCAFVAAATSPGFPWTPLKASAKLSKKHVPGLARWRESRLVVLPSHQGLGVGNLVSNAVAAAFVRNGHQYYSRTSHPKMVESRHRSPHWTENSNSGTMQQVTEWPTTAQGEVIRGGRKRRTDQRVGYSFEYMGEDLGGKYRFSDPQKSEVSCPGCTVLQAAGKTCRNCGAALAAAKAARRAGWRVR
jgi:GNAT superfamily N-acetyltransferase